MKIPLQYMAIFSLCANDRVKDRKSTVKQYIELNIQKRREYLRKHPATNSKCRINLDFWDCDGRVIAVCTH